MDLIDQMDEQNRIHFGCLLFIGMTNTTYAPSFTHMRTNTYACILSDTRFVAEKLSVKVVAEKLSVKEDTKKLKVKKMKLVYFLSVWSPIDFLEKLEG